MGRGQLERLGRVLIMDNNHTVFVYGTLKMGGGLAHVLSSGYYAGEAVIAGRLFNLGAFPGLKQAVGFRDKLTQRQLRSRLGEVAFRIGEIPGADLVLGEVYRVSDAVIQNLDRVEGVSSGLYERRAVIAYMLQPRHPGLCEVATAYHYERDIDESDRIPQTHGHPQFDRPLASWGLTDHRIGL